MQIYPQINELIATISRVKIPNERKQLLQPLVNAIQQKVADKKPTRLNFICTHNSRRSHLSQIWAKTMAYYFGIDSLQCYSAGTEATAMFPMVVETLKNTGFKVANLSSGNNPVYSIKYADNEPSIVGFSKVLATDFNPKTEFIAIMTCANADENCPFIAGAEQRIAITYDDPKVFDNTPLQAEKYLERSEQIAAEMYWVFSQIEE